MSFVSTSEFSIGMVPNFYIWVMALSFSIFVVGLIWIIGDNKEDDRIKYVTNRLLVCITIVFMSLLFAQASSHIVPVEVYSSETEIGLNENVEGLYISDVGKSTVDISLEEYEQPLKIKLIGDYGDVHDSVVFENGETKDFIFVKPSNIEEYYIKVLDREGNVVGESAFSYSYSHRKIGEKGWFHRTSYDCEYGHINYVEDLNCFSPN